MTVEAKDYGADLRMMRKHRNLTQKDLAVRMGLGHTTVSKLESGVQPPSLIQLHQWAEACGFDVRLFYSRRETQGVFTSAPEFRDYCTDPDNCHRCRHSTPTWDQVRHDHAGIPVGQQKPRPDAVVLPDPDPGRDARGYKQFVYPAAKDDGRLPPE